MKMWTWAKCAMAVMMMVCMVLGLVLLASCKSAPSTTGVGGARQQSLSVVIKADSLTASATQPAVMVSVDGMSYDGTRGDVGGTKAATETGDATASSSRQLNLSQNGGAGTTAAEALTAAVTGTKTGRETVTFVPDATVPAGLTMSLDEWNKLKKDYLECPECQALTPEEEAALKAATSSGE